MRPQPHRNISANLGKSVASMPPARHAAFLKVYANDQHFLMGFNAELRRLKEEGEE